LQSRSIQKPTPKSAARKKGSQKDPQDQEESAHGRRRRRSSLTQLIGNPIMQEIIRSMHAHES
jgi:hypothetical protein